MGEIKEKGEFIYQYLGEGKVAIAYHNLSHLLGPMVARAKMEGLAKYSDRIFDLKYGGVNYLAYIFEGIGEDELRAVLS